MKRRHKELLKTKREWKKHYASHVEDNIDYAGNRIGKDPNEINCDCDKQIGRFRKNKAGGCRHARCYICHGDKFPKRHQTWQEQQAELKLKEGVEDLK